VDGIGMSAPVAGMRTLEDAAAIIASGAVAVIAGTDELLRQLPRGSWIGGTMRYFMTPAGGLETDERVLVTELPVEPAQVKVRSYNAAELPWIITDAPANGFSLAILPSGSAAHVAYAERAPYLPGLFRTPIVGWVSGVRLADLGSVAPLAFNGRTGEVTSDRAVVLHAQLPVGLAARVGIVNPFEMGSGDVITFPQEAMSARECFVGGEPRNFAQYLKDSGADTRLPLVADYAGVLANTSVQAVDAEAGLVRFYAPVFTGIEYRMAAPVPDYRAAYAAALAAAPGDAAFACNCILNYVYGELEGQTVGNLVGPMTFGEIAYQLLNQTVVRLSIVEV
jgi:hypothetical protein